MSWPRPAVACLAFIFASAASGADWPQWQGIHRDGKSPETGLLQDWPAGGPPLVWKATDLGGGYSGPSVAGGRVYGMGYVGPNETAWALNLADGQKAWSTTIAPASHNFDYDQGPRATPTIDGQRMFTLGGGGELACLDNQTGKIVWQKNLARDFGGQMMSGWGFAESPLVDGERLICTPGGNGGTLMALNKETGAVRWRCKQVTDKAAYCSAIKAEINGVPQYIQLTVAHVIGVACDDGRLLWQAPRRGSTAVITTPVFHNGFVYVTSAYGAGCNLFKITANDHHFEATQVYANHNMSNHHGGVVLVGDYIYGFTDRGWICQDFSTGSIVWEEGRRLGKGSIAYADGRLYLRSESGPGTVALIEATPRGYREHGRFNQPDRSQRNSWPHPVIADGKLFLRDQNVLLCYDIKAK